MRHVVKATPSCGKPSTSILREQLLRAPVVVHSDIQVSLPTINLVTPAHDVEINFEPMEVDESFGLDPLDQLMELIHEELRVELGVPEVVAPELGVREVGAPIYEVDFDAAFEAAFEMLPEEVAPVAAEETANEGSLEGVPEAAPIAAEEATEEAAEEVADEGACYEDVNEEAAPVPAVEVDEVIPNDGLDAALGEAFENPQDVQQQPLQEYPRLFRKILADIGDTERKTKEKKTLVESLKSQLREVEKEMKDEEANLQKKRATKINLENLVSTKIKHEKIRDAADVKIRKISEELFGKG